MRNGTPFGARRIGLLVVAAAAMGSLVTGCGGSEADDSGGGGTGAAGGSGDNTSKAAQYSQCMRKNGVPAFPDPDPNGRMVMRASPGSGLDPQSPQYKAAEEACKSLRPPGLGGNGSVNPKQQEQMLKFVKCMRENGVPKFPDQQGGGIRINKSDGVDPDSPEFKAAMQKCESLLAGGAPGGS